MKRTRIFLFALLVASVAPGQRLVTVDTTAPPGDEYAEVYSISNASPAGGLLFWLPGPAHVPGPVDNGGVTCDNTDGVLYSCDGANAYSRNNPYYFPATAPPPAPPVIPAVLAGPVTGMAIDHQWGGPVRFWWCDGNQIVQADPAGVVTYGPFSFVPHGPYRGLDTDPFTGNLWVVDVNATVYEVNVAGPPALVNTFPATTYAPPGPASGVALDKSCMNPLQVFVSFPGPPGPMPPPPGVAFDQFSGAAVPLIHALPNGLTYHAAPVRLPGAGACGAAPPPRAVYDSPMTTGNAGFQLTVEFAPGPGLLVLSTGHVPGGYAVAGLIGTVHVDLTVPHVVIPVAPPFAMSLATVPVCVTGYAQWAFPCGAQWVLTDALQLDFSAP